MNGVFTCSIDDGHPSDLKIAELLSKNCLNGTFFIPIKNREGLPVLSKSQIRDIGRQFEIGSHTYDHCYLRNVGVEEAFYQITEGKKLLEDMLGKRVAGFCYPGGKYKLQHENMVQSAGFEYARTTTNLCFDVGQNRFEMPTTIQFYPHSKAVYFRNFVKAGNWGKRRNGLILALKHNNWIERLYALFEHSCLQGGVFHLWTHSHDIDKLNAWREFDEFLVHVATKIRVENRLNNQQLIVREFFADFR